MTEPTPQSSGVRELISRIRDDGVQAGRQEAEKIVAEARREAARLLADAKAKADEMLQKTRAEVESFRQATLEALKMAARDARLQLEAEVLAAFERHVKRLVSSVTHNDEFIRALILELAGQAAARYPKGSRLEILVSDLLAGKARENAELDEGLRRAVLAISSDMLREGVEVIPSSEVSGGARLRVVGDNVEVDLTDEAISTLLLKFLLPRYRAILEGIE